MSETYAIAYVITQGCEVIKRYQKSKIFETGYANLVFVAKRN